MYIMLIFLIIVLGIMIFVHFFDPNHLFYNPSKEIYNVVPDSIERLSLKSTSGNTLSGYRIFADSPRKGLFIFFHGNSRNITAHYKTYKFLSKAGYDVILYDYSGYGKSTGRATRENIFKDGRSILNQTIPAYHDSKIIVGGISLGGNIAMAAVGACNCISKIDMLFLDCTFLSYKKLASHLIKKYIPFFGFIGEMAINDKYGAKRFVYIVHKVKNILCSHCIDDEVIPFKFGEELNNELEPNDFWKLTGGHTAAYWSKTNQKKLIKYMGKI